MMQTLLVILKWRYLRWVVRRREISFKKFMCRMHWIQELEKLPHHDIEELRRYRYSKLRRMFIEEFPDAYLHNPYKD